MLPLVEVRAEFELSLAELRDADRGAADADLEPLDKAAHQIAVAENIAVFHGWHGALTGIGDASPHEAIALGEPHRRLSAAGGAMRSSGCCTTGSAVRTPWRSAASSISASCETAEHGGYPLLEHLRKILEGPIVWAPGVKGAIVVSLRGGDFLFESGQDLSIGYDGHCRRVVSPVPRGELQLPRRDAGGGRGAERLNRPAAVT